MTAKEHPLTQYFDAIGVGRHPTAADVDGVVASIVGDELNRTADHLAAADVRKFVTDQTRRMVDLYTVGNAGEARRVGRAAADHLAGQLPEYRPPSKGAGKTIAEIVAEVPRW